MTTIAETLAALDARSQELWYIEDSGWLHPMNNTKMISKSVIPHPFGTKPGQWYLDKLPQRNVQGWKLHISVNPIDQRALFNCLAPMLIHSDIVHKFLPHSVEKSHVVTQSGWANLTAENYEAQGKCCAIYPRDPTHLVDVAWQIHNMIMAHNAAAERRAMIARQNMPPERRLAYKPKIIRPHPFDVPGDLHLKLSPYTYIRYGGFSGPMTEGNGLVYMINPQTGEKEVETRFIKPYPDFARNIPAQFTPYL